MTERLLASGVEAELTDAARIGLVTYRHLLGQPETDPVAVLYQAQHTKGLTPWVCRRYYLLCADRHPALFGSFSTAGLHGPGGQPAHGA